MRETNSSLLFQEMELLEASFYGQRKKVWILLQQKVAVNCIDQVEYAYTIGSQTQREYYSVLRDKTSECCGVIRERHVHACTSTILVKITIICSDKYSRFGIWQIWTGINYSILFRKRRHHLGLNCVLGP